MTEYRHTPVMLKEALEYLDPEPGENFIDCTLGGGGYTMEIAKRVLPDGKVLAIDLDEMAIANAKLQITKNKLQNIILAHDNFKNLQKIAEKYFKPQDGFSGIVFDLGLSRAQLSCRSRGFSFRLAGSPLDMNFGGPARQTAEMIINNRAVGDLIKIFKEYGEEKFSRGIALAIARRRQIKKIKTTDDLVEIIMGAIPKKFQFAGRIHPATRIFQALRIAVNDELENLRAALPQAVDSLGPGGRLVVISYHSLEDRIVKRFFREEAKGCVCPPEAPVCQCGRKPRLRVLTPKALRPSEEEVLNNPGSRSAKLRAAVKR